MKIVIPVKRVASLDDEFEMREDGCDVEADFCDHDMNEFDEYALEAAMGIKEAAGDAAVELVAVTVGDDAAEDVLRKALAKGADRAIRVWSDVLEGSDQMAIARVLAPVVAREQPVLVLCGAQSSDHGHAQTGMAVAGLLGWNHAAVVSALDYKPGATTATIRRELEGGLEQELELEMPAVLTVQLGMNRPRYASLRAIKQAAAKPIEVLSPKDLGLADEAVGQSAAVGHIRRAFVPERGRSEMIGGSPTEQAVRLLEIIREGHA